MATLDDVRTIALGLPGAAERVDVEHLREVITDAWLLKAPARVRREWLANES